MKSKNRLLLLVGLMFCLFLTGCNKKMNYTGQYRNDEFGYSIYLKDNDNYEWDLLTERGVGTYSVSGDKITLLPTFEIEGIVGTYKDNIITIDEVEYIKTSGFIVDFNVDGGTPIMAQNVEKGGLITKPTTPTKTDDYFVNWYKDKKCTQEFDFTETVTKNMTLYAKWEIFCEVILDKTEGTGGSDVINPVYNRSMPANQVAPKSNRTDYLFLGYYDAIEGGKKFYHADMTSAARWDRYEWATLYAQWILEGTTFEVTFDFQGGNGGTSSVEVKYGRKMPNIDAPIRTDYTFVGYFDQIDGGKQYYDEDLNSVLNWDINENTTLYARWKSNESFKVTLERMNGTGGSTEIFAILNQAMPKANAPTRERFTFLGYYDNIEGGKQYYYPDMSSVTEWDKEDKDFNYVLYAQWISDDYYTVGLEFEVDELEQASYVKKYTGTSHNVIIPVSYEGYIVKEIADNAFASTVDNKNNEILTVTIPYGVERIGKAAFNWCQKLINISIPSSVEDIDERAFFHCSRLKSINIPSAVKSIRTETFAYCNSLEVITISNTVVYLGSEVFKSWLSNQTIIFLGYAEASASWDENWKKSCYAKVVWSS